MPVTPRDFYLSKLYQFLLTSFTVALLTDESLESIIGVKLSVYRLLNDELDRIPDSPREIARLAEFNLFKFQQHIRRAAESKNREEMLDVCSDLFPKYLPQIRRLRPSDDDGKRRAERRERKVAQYRKQYPEQKHWVKEICRAADAHPSQYHKWLRGELPDESAVTHKIEQAIDRHLHRKAQRADDSLID